MKSQDRDSFRPSFVYREERSPSRKTRNTKATRGFWPLKLIKNRFISRAIVRLVRLAIFKINDRRHQQTSSFGNFDKPGIYTVASKSRMKRKWESSNFERNQSVSPLRVELLVNGAQLNACLKNVTHHNRRTRGRCNGVQLNACLNNDRAI